MLKLKRIMIASLLAVSTLSGVAFAETDAEKIKRLESELQQYKEISAKYNADLHLSHQKYQEYQAEIDDSFVKLQQKLTQQLEVSKFFEAEETTHKSGLEEEVKKTSDIKNDLGAVQTKIQNLENKEKQLQTEKDRLINTFNVEKTQLEKQFKIEKEALQDAKRDLMEQIQTKTKEAESTKFQLISIEKKYNEKERSLIQGLEKTLEAYKTDNDKFLHDIDQKLKQIKETQKINLQQLHTNIDEISNQIKQLRR